MIMQVFRGGRSLFATHRSSLGVCVYGKEAAFVLGDNRQLSGLGEQQQKLRKYSVDSFPKEKPKRERTLPRLMDFQEVIWPSAFKSIRNWIIVQFVIRPYFDAEFNIKEFIVGAKQACQMISLKLASGDFQALESQRLVTPEVLEELKPIVQHLSVSQRRQLEIDAKDIYLSFPYQVGIMFDESDDAKTQKRWVEITMVLHMISGYREMQQNHEQIPWNMGSLPEYQDKIYICNYRFKKEFTNGNQSDWTVNAVNHFKPIDLISEQS